MIEKLGRYCSDRYLMFGMCNLIVVSFILMKRCYCHQSVVLITLIDYMNQIYLMF